MFTSYNIHEGNVAWQKLPTLGICPLQKKKTNQKNVKNTQEHEPAIPGDFLNWRLFIWLHHGRVQYLLPLLLFSGAFP